MLHNYDMIGGKKVGVESMYTAYSLIRHVNKVDMLT